jgi:ankyrin repeat protein
MDDGIRSLLIASQKGHLDVVRELLARGANIEAADNIGATSLFAASQVGYLDVVRELLARGAVVDAAFDTGATPLIQASWSGHTEVVRALLDAGANKRHVDNVGDTADSLAGTFEDAPAGSRAAILALLAAAP